MIIDAHCHLADKDWYSDTWWNELAKLYVHPLKYRFGMDMTPQQIVEKILPDLFDPTGEKLIAEMDKAGINMTVLCPLDMGLALGDSKVSIEEQKIKNNQIKNNSHLLCQPNFLFFL